MLCRARVDANDTLRILLSGARLHSDKYYLDPDPNIMNITGNHHIWFRSVRDIYFSGLPVSSNAVFPKTAICRIGTTTDVAGME